MPSLGLWRNATAQLVIFFGLWVESTGAWWGQMAVNPHRTIHTLCLSGLINKQSLGFKAGYSKQEE